MLLQKMVITFFFLLTLPLMSKPNSLQTEKELAHLDRVITVYSKVKATKEMQEIEQVLSKKYHGVVFFPELRREGHEFIFTTKKENLACQGEKAQEYRLLTHLKYNKKGDKVAAISLNNVEVSRSEILNAKKWPILSQKLKVVIAPLFPSNEGDLLSKVLSLFKTKQAVAGTASNILVGTCAVILVACAILIGIVLAIGLVILLGSNPIGWALIIIFLISISVSIPAFIGSYH